MAVENLEENVTSAEASAAEATISSLPLPDEKAPSDGSKVESCE